MNTHNEKQTLVNIQFKHQNGEICDLGDFDGGTTLV